MRRILRKIAEDKTKNIGDTPNLLDITVFCDITTCAQIFYFLKFPYLCQRLVTQHACP